MRNLMFVGLVALGAIGCGGSGSKSNPDMAMSNADLATNPDLAPACISTTPASNTDFLNHCTTADSVEITPFYPTDAPGGVLPPLQ